MCNKFRNFLLVAAVGILVCGGAAGYGQSSDQNLPTAVLSNEISGTIRALDVGDPRLTRHFYAFDGNPGDLIITLDSRNLNGDVDVFTAVTFRPLIKISMYAETSGEVSKSIYLRSHQIFILRVEARTPSDEPGSYRIRLSGSFRPFSGGIPVAENSVTEEAPRQSNVSSVGERIERPAEPTSEVKPVEQPAEETAKTSTPKPRTSTRAPRRNTRSARNRPAPRSTAPKTATTKTQSENVEPAKPAEGEEKSGTPPEEKSAAAKPAESEKPIPAGPRLVIERTDGDRVDRPMSAVRRVVIESGVIVVTLKNGRVERIPLSTISRMAIEP